jgi:TolA-binding protein
MSIMRHTRSVIFAAILLMSMPAPVYPVSKEMQELQRDIAQLQDQVRTLQSALDQKMATLTVLAQQALDASTKANTNVSVLNAGVTSTLERELHNALTPVAGLAAKVDNTNNDVSEVRSQMADLNNQMNKMMQKLDDLSNNIKVLQAAPAATQPPPPTGAGQSAPPPDAGAVFNNAYRDESSGKLDLAISEYQDFIKFYPDDPNAPRAQYNIGECHYTQQKFELAASEFDSVITRYPDNATLAPQAYFMKGMALRNISKTQAIAAWRKVIEKYPNSDSAANAKQQLHAIGATASAAPPAKKRVK